MNHSNQGASIKLKLTSLELLSRSLSVALKHGRWLALLAGFRIFAGIASAQSIYTQAYTFSTLAGNPTIGNADGIGSNARFFYPFGIALDQYGNLYVGDSRNYTVRKVTAAGVVSTLAGFPGSPGSVDGTNSSARFSSLFGVAVDRNGNVYVCDGNNTIRELKPVGASWVVSTIAGLAGTSGTNDGAGTNALFNGPEGIAVDTNGNLYVADGGNATIREITRMGSNWVVSTISGQAGNPGNVNGTGTNAQYSDPIGLALDNSGNLFVVDEGNDAIRELSLIGTDWVATSVAGGTFGSRDGLNGQAQFYSPKGIAVDSADNLYVGDSLNNTVRKVSPLGPDWLVTTLAGSADGCSSCSADGTGTNAQFQEPCGVAVDPVGNVFVTDFYNNSIRSITSGGVVSTLAGTAHTSGSTDGTGSSALFFYPQDLVVDKSGNVYVGDRQNYTIRKVTAAGVVSTVAGLAGFFGTNDGTGSNARFGAPNGLAVDGSDNVYVADSVNQANGSSIQKITPGGVVTTIDTGLDVPLWHRSGPLRRSLFRG